MLKYRVYHSARFDREFARFGLDFQNKVDKTEDQLVENPYAGSPLNVKWFREKGIGKYRAYFLIYEEFKAIFMVGISEKKDQQKVINTIRLLFEFFREELERLIDREDLD